MEKIVTVAKKIRLYNDLFCEDLEIKCDLEDKLSDYNYWNESDLKIENIKDVFFDNFFIKIGDSRYGKKYYIDYYFDDLTSVEVSNDVDNSTSIAAFGFINFLLSDGTTIVGDLAELDIYVKNYGH